MSVAEPHHMDIKEIKPEPLIMDLSYLKIRVDKFRVITEKQLIFIASTEHSVGYLIYFFSLFNSPKVRIRRLEGIDVEHLMSKNGVFNLKGISRVYFHYYNHRVSKIGVELAYSLNISFNDCYISLKCKSADFEVSEIKLIVSDGKKRSETRSIQAQTEENRSAVSIKMTKAMDIKDMSYFDKFEINLLDHFEFKGQGIDINYPVTNIMLLRPYFYLEIDTKLESYDLEFQS